MIRINLLGRRPADQEDEAAEAAARRRRPGAVQAYLFLAPLRRRRAASLCAGVCAGGSRPRSRSSTRRSRRPSSASRELQAIKKQVDDLEPKRATFQRKVDLIERLKAEQSGPVHMLDEISKALPDFVWLTSLDQTGDRPSGSTGQSNGLTSVADFISALQRTRLVPAAWTSSPAPRPNNIVTFALQAAFKNPEVAAKEAAAAAAASRRRGRPPPPPPRAGAKARGGGSHGRQRPHQAVAWPASSASRRCLALVIGGAVLVAVLVARHGRGEDEDGQARGPAARRSAPSRSPPTSSQEFQREVALLEAKLETLKRILPPEKETPDLMRKVQSLAAQSSLTIKNVHARRDGEQGVLPGVADQHGRRGHLPQPGHLLRPGVAPLAPGQRRQPQDQARAATQTRLEHDHRRCVATTFVYVDTPPPAAAGRARRGAGAPVMRTGHASSRIAVALAAGRWRCRRWRQAPAAGAAAGARRQPRRRPTPIKSILDQELAAGPGRLHLQPAGPARSLRQPAQARVGRPGRQDAAGRAWRASSSRRSPSRAS